MVIKVKLYSYVFLADIENKSLKKKRKRVRSSFHENQLLILQTRFRVDSNPDGQDLEKFVQTLELSKRVTQVWFQNTRARHQKDQMEQPKHTSKTPEGSDGTTKTHEQDTRRIRWNNSKNEVWLHNMWMLHFFFIDCIQCW